MDLPPPKTGKRARNPNSKTAQKFAMRTLERMTPAMLQRRDLFIRGLLLGRSKAEAARMAGASTKRATRVGSDMYNEAYVQDRLKELREKLTESEICTRNELVLNLKSIGFDESIRADMRVRAHKVIAEILGFNKPIKVEGEFSSGVMVLPAGMTREEWEVQAVTQQEALKEDITK